MYDNFDDLPGASQLPSRRPRPRRNKLENHTKPLPLIGTIEENDGDDEGSAPAVSIRASTDQDARFGSNSATAPSPPVSLPLDTIPPPPNGAAPLPPPFYQNSQTSPAELPHARTLVSDKLFTVSSIQRTPISPLPPAPLSSQVTSSKTVQPTNDLDNVALSTSALEPIQALAQAEAALNFQLAPSKSASQIPKKRSVSPQEDIDYGRNKKDGEARSDRSNSEEQSGNVSAANAGEEAPVEQAPKVEESLTVEKKKVVAKTGPKKSGKKSRNLSDTITSTSSRMGYVAFTPVDRAQSRRAILKTQHKLSQLSSSTATSSPLGGSSKSSLNHPLDRSAQSKERRKAHQLACEAKARAHQGLKPGDVLEPRFWEVVGYDQFGLTAQQEGIKTRRAERFVRGESLTSGSEYEEYESE